MNLLQVYNDYRSFCGGEDAVVRRIAAIVEKRGGTARLLMRSSKGLDEKSRRQSPRLCLRNLQPLGYREMAETLAADRPDLVHAHNLYPFFSPSVLVACRRAGVPVVMTTHNYFLTCPVINHLYQGTRVREVRRWAESTGVC